MRLSLRFILPLALVLSALAYGVVPLVDGLTLKWFVRDLDMRTQLITNTLHDSLVILAREKNTAKAKELFSRVTLDDRLYALGFCDPSDQVVFKTPTFPATLQCKELRTSAAEEGKVYSFPSGPLHVAIEAISDADVGLGHLVLLHDMSFIARRSEDTKKYVFYLFIVLGGVISLVTVLVAQLSWKGWVSGMRALLRGEGLLRPIHQITSPELRPIAKDIRTLIWDLESDRRARDVQQISWSAKSLKGLLHKELAGDEILIVSNRQPYIHTRKDGKIEVQVPASGLVTALEPIMRACSGTWIAHGSGDADRDVVDRFDHVAVPPENPAYRIRRVWLTKEEEEGYYYGFSNEGIWPLCHIAHTRPIFRTQDWEMYKRVNEKFAQAVVSEAKTEDPVILVQDYHLALVPRMIKKALPRATIITFWHIPWPNAEAFGICPWREEILDGMLGSTILGFHTRFHCNNFIETVDRFLECRIDRETSTISFGNELTAVNQYPISIEWPARWLKDQKPIDECQRIIRESNGMNRERRLGIGVDRLDYTKGILERFYAVERLLETHPEWIGKFTFIQIAAPTRSSIGEYSRFDSEVRALADKINQRFANGTYQPICLKIAHHGPDEVFRYFRGSDVCVVSSLHDGMNLVAKEFIASRDDERGVLILSQFTGASRELPEALIVNPYDIDQCAQALHIALTLPESEQRDRMRNMRGLIQEFNVFRWAGRMLIDAARIRLRGRFVNGSAFTRLSGKAAN